PLPILKGFASLRRIAGTYPPGHPMIAQKLRELDEAIKLHLRAGPEVRIDVIHGEVFLDGVSFGRDKQANAQIIHELADLGIDSIHIAEGVDADELLRMAQFLWQVKERPRTGSIEAQLAEHQVRHVSVGRLVALDTRWRSHQWPEAPSGNLDPAYAESLLRAQETFEAVSAGKKLDAVTVRDLVQLLIHRVARSNAALGQILAVKQYENLTYCHSVNVAMLSLLLGTELGLDESFKAALVEAALLHDIGKTR